jgi:hypothetical protein
VALTTGFHTLIDLVARNETNQKAKDAGPVQAVRRRRWEFVELLLRHGADLKSVPLVGVLRSWDPKMIRFFLDSGADALLSDPFTEAFTERIRTALRPFTEYKKSHPEFAERLQEQIDRALRHFARAGA